MLYFRMQEQRVVEARTESPHKEQGSGAVWIDDAARGYAHPDVNGWFCRGEIFDFEVAEKIAMDLSIAAMKAGQAGIRYVATDAGEYVSPRFDVIELPAQGDKVSRYFNGDSYPAGTIQSVSKSLRRIETTDGTVFLRRRDTGSWVNNRTWSMRSGHHREWNPSF